MVLVVVVGYLRIVTVAVAVVRTVYQFIPQSFVAFCLFVAGIFLHAASFFFLSGGTNSTATTTTATDSSFNHEEESRFFFFFFFFDYHYQHYCSNTLNCLELGVGSLSLS